MFAVTNQDKLLYIQAMLEVLAEASTTPTDSYEVEHIFAEGTCTRQMKVCAGTLVIGKRHKHSTINMLLQGEMLVMSDTGLPPQVLKAPCTFVSPPGDKKMGLAITDVVWCNVFPAASNNLDEVLAEAVIEEDAIKFKELKGVIACQLQQSQSAVQSALAQQL